MAFQLGKQITNDPSLVHKISSSCMRKCLINRVKDDSTFYSSDIQRISSE